jgi:hypothetical protein
MAPSKKRAVKKKTKVVRCVKRRPKRELNEFELLFARLGGLADRTLEVFERDPERGVNAVLGAIEGVGKIGEFVRQQPAEAKRVAAALAAEGVNRLSHAVIAASARQLRRDLNGKKRA